MSSMYFNVNPYSIDKAKHWKGIPNVHTGHEVEVDEAGVEEVEDKVEVGEVEEDNNRDKEEQSSRSSSLIVRAGAESTSNQH